MDDKSAEELLAQANEAHRQGRYREAADAASRAIELKADFVAAYWVRGRARQRLAQLPDAIADFSQILKLEKNASAYTLRGECYSGLDRHTEAIADFDRALALEPKLTPTYHLRGRELFKAGEIDKSIADLDRFIELAPEHENACWERGLSRCYAGQFAKAQKSFEDYHKVGPEDIENGLWRMLSQAEIEGLPAAQKALFKYEPKRRPPFPLLYDLYSGKIQPGDVSEHATDGAKDETDRRTRTFYAHLYVGMWFVVNRDRDRAVAHLEKAVALRSTDYMWYVARLQLQRLKMTRSA